MSLQLIKGIDFPAETADIPAGVYQTMLVVSHPEAWLELDDKGLIEAVERNAETILMAVYEAVKHERAGRTEDQTQRLVVSYTPIGRGVDVG